MSKDKKKSILFIYPEISTFVQRDYDILIQKYKVKSLKYQSKKDLIKLIWGVLTTNINYSWFVLGHATVAVFLSKVFMKKSIVIAGGWDVVNMPEINYGALQNRKGFLRTQLTLKYADRVLAVSESTKKEVLNCCCTGNIMTVYNGINPELYHPGNYKKALVLTVGGIDWETVTKKGLKTFVISAKYLPDIEFVLAGNYIDDSHEHLKSIATPNVKFTGYIPFDELLTLYQSAKVYVQVSAHESFSCSLAEAMLCECVPVVTNRAALPEVVGETGFYVDYNDPEQTARKIKEALKSEKGPAARERVKTLYPIMRRKEEVLKVIEEVFRE